MQLDVSLCLEIEPLTAASCRQTLHGRIKVGIFGMGRIIEGVIKDQLQTTYK